MTYFKIVSREKKCIVINRIEGSFRFLSVRIRRTCDEGIKKQRGGCGIRRERKRREKDKVLFHTSEV